MKEITIPKKVGLKQSRMDRIQSHTITLFHFQKVEAIQLEIFSCFANPAIEQKVQISERNPSSSFLRKLFSHSGIKSFGEISRALAILTKLSIEGFRVPRSIPPI